MKIVNNFNNNGLQFKALDRSVTDNGAYKYKFYLPKQDSKNVKVELVALKKDGDGFYKPCGKPQTVQLNNEQNSYYQSCTIRSSSPSIKQIFKDDHGRPLTDEKGNPLKCFGYRYVDGKQHFLDSGVCTNPISQDPEEKKYTIVNPDRPIIKRNGITQLIMTDSYEIGQRISDKFDINDVNEFPLDQRKINKNKNFQRTFVNQYGGNLTGIMAHAKSLAQEEGVKTIVGMPFTRDTISSHKYWTQNPFRISDDFGNLDDFKKMQKELFKNGINYCLDAALVNEGLTGVRFQNVLEYGKKSPYYYSFNLNSDRPALAILPDNLENIAIRIFNEKQSRNYDSKRPMYIQFFDKRLATQEQLNSPELIEKYDVSNTKDNYEIISYYDSMPPYYFRIDKATFDKCKAEAKRKDPSYNKDKLIIDGNTKAFDVFCDNFKNFTVTKKTAPEGVDFWDGSVDIPKVKFFPNQVDNEIVASTPELADKIEMGYVSAQDTAIHSIEYWTDQTRQALMEYISGLFNADIMNNIKDVNSLKTLIEKMVDNGDLPDSLYNIDAKGNKTLKLSDALLESILDKSYSSGILNSIYINSNALPNYLERIDNADRIIYNSLRNYPLQAFECDNELSAILGSPYINKVAQKLADIKDGIDRNKEFTPIDECKETYNKVNLAYEKHLLPITKKVMKKIGENSNNKVFDVDPFDENASLTDYGKYILPLVVPEIINYTFKSTFKGNELVQRSKDNDINYKVDIGLPEEEAKFVAQKIYDKFKDLNQEDMNKRFIDDMCKKFKKYNLQGFMLADAIIDKTEAGLGMRIDASKDVASYDNVKQGANTADNAWEQALDFWNKAQEAMNRINPHNLTYAEITDLENYQNYYKGKSSVMAASKMFDKITAAADYTHFFSKLAGYTAGDLAEYTPINNAYASLGNIYSFYSTLAEGWDGAPGKLREMPADGIALSYTFANNHDKPRIVHSLSVNAQLFKSDFKNYEHRKIAANLLGIDDPNSINYENLSPKAVAVGHRFSDAFNELLSKPEYSQYNNDNFKKALKEAIAFYVAGQVPAERLQKNVAFDLKRAKLRGETFGARAFDLTIKDILNRIKEQNPTLIENTDTIRILKDEVMKIILEPALDKYLTMYKTMVCLPGAPTDFAGDRLGMTGFESFAKNIYQTNREKLNWENIGPSKDNIYNTFYNKSNEIAKIRNDYRLSALNDGETVVLTPFTADNKANKTYINKPKDAKGNKREDIDYISILRYNPKGSVVISTFLNDGIKKYGQDYDKFVNNKIDRTDLYIDEILLTPANSNEENPRAGVYTGLPEGMTFKKYGDDDDKGYYKVVNENDNSGHVKSFLRYFNSDGSQGKIHISPKDFNVGIFYAV